MKQIRITKQWRGHVPGDEPTLTDERAAELLTSGHAEELRAPEAVAAAQPKRSVKRKQANVNPHSYDRSDDRADNAG